VDTPVSIIEQIAERIRRTRRIRSTVCPFVLIRICTTMYMHCRTFLHVGASYLYCIHCSVEFTMAAMTKCRNVICQWLCNSQYCHECLLFSLIPPFYYATIHVLITWLISPHHPFYFPYHSDIPPYLCLSHSHLILLLSRIISLIVLCFYFSSYPHSLLSIWLSCTFYIPSYCSIFRSLPIGRSTPLISWHCSSLSFLLNSKYFWHSYW